MSHTASIYIHEARYAFIGLWRTPGFTFPTLAFPLMFYIFFGVIFNKTGTGMGMAHYLIATYGTFGVLGAALFGFGNMFAIERDQGWLLLKQVSPMPIGAYFFAKMAMSQVFAAIIIVLLFALGALAGGVELALSQWISMALIMTACGLPFAALGLCIGAWTNAASVAGVANLIYLPMGLLSGLWIPLSFFPEIMTWVARIFPAYHAAQLALSVMDLQHGDPLWLHVVVLIAQSMVFLALAYWGYQRHRVR